MVPRALTIAGSDSGGGAGIQADLKAFAAAGAHGMSAIVALTAQNTTGVTAVHEVPAAFVVAQLEAVYSDIGVDAAKTGMLFSRRVIEVVAAFLAAHPTPLVVDPVLVASSGAKLLEDDAVDALVALLFPLATVVTPNLPEARALAGDGTRAELAERLVALGAPRGARHRRSRRRRRSIISSTGATTSRSRSSGSTSRRRTAPGCTHSATLAALLARGLPLAEAARAAARVATEAVRNGLAELGAGDGPVDVLNVKGTHADG